MVLGRKRDSSASDDMHGAITRSNLAGCEVAGPTEGLPDLPERPLCTAHFQAVRILDFDDRQVEDLDLWACDRKVG